ncbi:hypothetical protein CPB84DRAFT_1772713 [Gymnopilus junonius]|uniref:Uncharacterized protein n=1 Tax=Gymnopilus junonius TaxID=109634 RepID=A0A9P5NTC8_GYMJU|nr:hypothetical protein CPB84DRAFT_1772713 [Gymnopilus junonius]
MDDTGKAAALPLPAAVSNPRLESSAAGTSNRPKDNTSAQTVKLDDLGPMVVNSDGVCIDISSRGFC